MRAVVVVIADILGHEVFQMTLIQHNDVFKQIASAVADKNLSMRGMTGLYHRKHNRIDPDGVLARHNFNPYQGFVPICVPTPSRSSLHGKDRAILVVGQSFGEAQPWIYFFSA
jgi:hypothetical protein